MGAAISLMKRVKQWFTVKPDEPNSTVDDIMKHHERQDGGTSQGATPSPFQKHAREWFTGKPEEYNSTNYPIRKHLEREDGGTSQGDATLSPFQMPVNVNNTTIASGSFTSMSSLPALVHSSPPPPPSLSLTQSQPSSYQVVRYQAIQPEVWPTKEEFQSAKIRIQYDPEKLHFAVCGGSGTGKSSLINAFRGLKSNRDSPQAARVGVDETTIAITRYPDPRKESPYDRLVWYDCPGAGTLKIPGWQYFNQQGLFIFDIIVLVYAMVIISINLSKMPTERVLCSVSLKSMSPLSRTANDSISRFLSFVPWLTFLSETLCKS